VHEEDSRREPTQPVQGWPIHQDHGFSGNLTHGSTSRESKSLPRATFLCVQTGTPRSDLDGVFGGVFQTIRRVDVDLGRRDILMPECVTYLFYGGTVLKGHCGKGMPQ